MMHESLHQEQEFRVFVGILCVQECGEAGGGGGVAHGFERSSGHLNAELRAAILLAMGRRT